MLSFVQRRPKVNSFDMTPMIDVVLQLIIFFMFTSRFGQITTTPIELPVEAGDRAANIERPTLVVDLNESGRFFIEARPVQLARVLTVVEQEIEALGSPAMVDMLVRAHRDVSAAPLNRLANALADRGVRNWKLGTVTVGSDAANGGGMR